MGIEEVELEDLDYIFKFTERLYIIMACINDGREITEDDYNVLQAVHKIMREGKLPFYKVICTDAPMSITEANLFDTDNPSVT